MRPRPNGNLINQKEGGETTPGSVTASSPSVQCANSYADSPPSKRPRSILAKRTEARYRGVFRRVRRRYDSCNTKNNDFEESTKDMKCSKT